MAVTVRAGDRVLAAGDSIATNTYWVPTAMDGIDAQFNPITAKYAGRATGTVASATGTVGSVADITTEPVITRINTAVPGSTVVDLAAAADTLITDHNPDVIWIYSGVNDVPGESEAVFAAAVDSLLSQLRAWDADVPILVCGIFTRGELWAPDPTRWNNPLYDDKIDDFNAVWAAACVTYNATFVDSRPEALAYEALNNPVPDPDGILTQDEIHPNANGVTMISDNVLDNCTVVQP